MSGFVNSWVNHPSILESSQSHLMVMPELGQLENIKTQLDLVLLALEALADLSSEDVLKAAADLHLDKIITDRVTLWRLRQSNPLRQSQGGRKKLDVEEARSLVLICCHLARQHQPRVREAVALLEDLNRPPHCSELLGDYLDNFCNFYKARMDGLTSFGSKALTQLALKLLVDLMFYGAPEGTRYFWLALLERSDLNHPA
jgi:hypothetical protein